MTKTTLSEFRNNVKEYVDSVINNSGSVLIDRGDTAAVLISLDEYNSIKETGKIISSPALSKELENSIVELESEKPIEVNIDEL